MNKFSTGLAALVLSISLGTVSAHGVSANCSDPKAFVEDVKNEVLKVLQSGQPDEQIKATLNSDFRSVADIGWMGKFALGRAYATLNPQQQQEYAATYMDYMSASYVNRFKKYNGQTITVNSVKPVNSEFEVDTTINAKDQSPVDVIYRLKPADSCFKVVDIIAEGVSLVTTQRQDFNSVFNAKGYDGLISLLKQKTAQFDTVTPAQ